MSEPEHRSSWTFLLVGLVVLVALAAPVAFLPIVGCPECTGQRIYAVQAGDTLSGISVKIYGSPRYVEKIHEANRDILNDPRMLSLGMKLVIPYVFPCHRCHDVRRLTLLNKWLKGREPRPG